MHGILQHAKSSGLNNMAHQDNPIAAPNIPADTPIGIPKFLNTHDQYQYDQDLQCTFTLGSCCLPREGDRVSIYQVGWKHSNDYHLFDWVPTDVTTNNEYTIFFNCDLLPESSSTLYEFVYTTVDNELLTRSKPFSFVRNSNDLAADSTMSKRSSYTSDAAVHSELGKLKEENAILKESLKLFVSQREPKHYDREITELKTLIYSLTDVVNKQRRDLTLLKNQVDVCLRVNNDLLDNKAELEQRLRQYEGASFQRAPHTTDDNTSLSSLTDYDVGELESIPPFPFAK